MSAGFSSSASVSKPKKHGRSYSTMNPANSEGQILRKEREPSEDNINEKNERGTGGILGGKGAERVFQRKKSLIPASPQGFKKLFTVDRLNKSNDLILDIYGNNHYDNIGQDLDFTPSSPASLVDFKYPVPHATYKTTTLPPTSTEEDYFHSRWLALLRAHLPNKPSPPSFFATSPSFVPTSPPLCQSPSHSPLSPSKEKQQTRFSSPPPSSVSFPAKPLKKRERKLSTSHSPPEKNNSFSSSSPPLFSSLHRPASPPPLQEEEIDTGGGGRTKQSKRLGVRINKDFWEGEGGKQEQDRKNQRISQSNEENGGRKETISDSNGFLQFAADLRARSMGSMGGELQEGGGMGGGKVELEKFSLEGKEPYILDRVRPWEGDSAFPGFKLRFAFQEESFTKTLLVKSNETIEHFVKMAFHSYQKVHRCTPEDPLGMGPDVKDLSDTVLKIPGKEVYIADYTINVMDLAYVRTAIAKKARDIVLAPVKKMRPSIPKSVQLPYLFDQVGDEIDLECREIKAYDASQITKPFLIRLFSVSGFDWNSTFSKRGSSSNLNQTGLFVEVTLSHGSLKLFHYISKPSESGLWAEVINTKIAIQNLPRAARLSFTVWGFFSSKKTLLMQQIYNQSNPSGIEGVFPLGWVNFMVYGYEGKLQSGDFTLRLWPDQICKTMGTTCINWDVGAPSLTFLIPSSPHPIVSLPPPPPPSSLPPSNSSFPPLNSSFTLPPSSASNTDKRREKKGEILHRELGGGRSRLSLLYSHRLEETLKEFGSFSTNNIPNEEEKATLHHMLQDPLRNLSKAEKEFIWKFRTHIVNDSPHFLPSVIISADWGLQSEVQEVYKLLQNAPLLPPFVALRLLDAQFPDPFVRRYAIQCLAEMSDLDLEDIFLQLVQTLKHEPHYASELAFFLFLRSVLHPCLLGHTLFWYLESETEVESSEISEKFQFFKMKLLMGFGDSFMNGIIQQVFVVRQLLEIAKKVKEIKERDKRDDLLCSSLEHIAEMTNFHLPIDPRIIVKCIIPSRCRTMQSATVPLNLCFENADPLGSDYRLLFKVGDDLRQDILVLQIIRLFDNFWKEEGRDLHVSPYHVISTGARSGMVEIVPQAKTTAEIQKECGGGALGALKEDVLWTYLKKGCGTEREENPKRQVFAMSCAAYCVISHVLGLGDRHNDNILVNEGGRLFHIDFGFILGNYLKFAGIERETTPFVLTREMVYVMGGQNSDLFQMFCKTGKWAYQVVRKHSHLFLSLFLLMLSTGTPNLQKVEDLYYFRDTLKMKLTVEETNKEFDELIRISLKNTRVYLNNVVHILAN